MSDLILTSNSILQNVLDIEKYEIQISHIKVLIKIFIQIIKAVCELCNITNEENVLEYINNKLIKINNSKKRITQKKIEDLLKTSLIPEKARLILSSIIILPKEPISSLEVYNYYFSF